jgi:hypothetical protein
MDVIYAMDEATLFDSFFKYLVPERKAVIRSGNSKFEARNPKRQPFQGDNNMI